ncbi:MAG: hypothetical protein D3916_08545 [Candidatus Electrothrix sp. MAN1_4]|nr:hypothetical protein [Candidatus Electrothrix sp. MAN1_4]
MKKVASLKYGVVFKKAFCDPEIFTAFVQDMLGLSVLIKHVEAEKEFDPPVGYIKPRFDLFAEDASQCVIVDIQHARTIDHYDRFLYYHCVALLEQISNSANYRPGLKVFTVVVLTSGDRHGTPVSITDFDPHDLSGRPLREIPHKIIYLCPKYVSEETPQPYREWLEAINDTLDEEVDESLYRRAEIQKLFTTIQIDHISPEERACMIEEYHQEELQEVAVEEGKRDIASSLLRQGVPVEVVAKATGVPMGELAAMQGEKGSACDT